LIAFLKQEQIDGRRERNRMSDWQSEVIGNNLIAVYEGFSFTEDALLWLREKPRTFGELRAEEIDWLRWMAANVDDQNLLEKLSRDLDTDVRMWVACNPMTPELVLGRLAEDPVVFVRRGVAQNKSAPMPLLTRLSDDADVVVRTLVSRNRTRRSRRRDPLREPPPPGTEI
jgi:hypothetical protein